jgi:excisionase family DNA binding protein
MENPFEIINERLSSIENLLLEIHSKLEFSKNEEKDVMMDISEVSKHLNLAVPTIYSKVSSRELPSYKNGKRLYFSKKEIDEWMKSNKRKTHAEIKLEVEQYMSKRKK